MQRLQIKNNLLSLLCSFSRSPRHSKSSAENGVTKVSVPANWTFNSRMLDSQVFSLPKGFQQSKYLPKKKI